MAWDVTISMTLPSSFLPVECDDSRMRIVVRKANLHEATKVNGIWVFYINPKYIRYLDYSRMPDEVRELLAMLVTETQDDENLASILTPRMATATDPDLPPPDCAGYRLSKESYLIYISRESFNSLCDLDGSLLAQDVKLLKGQ